MTNVHDISSSDDAYDEASLWVAKLDRGLSASEKQALQNWMAADANNVALLQSMTRMWDKMYSLSRLSELFPEPPSHQCEKPSLFASLFGRTQIISASFVVVLILGAWAFSQFSSFGVPWDEERDSLVAAVQVHETGIGERLTATLVDGTQVTLNTNSRMRVEYTSSARLLTLDRGELNVKVAKDSSRPLSVIAHGQIVQAVGTEFNVEIKNDQLIELVVTEGRVQVGTPASTDSASEAVVPSAGAERLLLVSAGEELMLGSTDRQVKRVSPEEIAAKLSWRSGNLIFRGETLEEAIKEISRYTRVEFVILDDELSTERVSGLFKAGDVDGLLAALRSNFDIRYEKIGDQKVLLASK